MELSRGDLKSRGRADGLQVAVPYGGSAEIAARRTDQPVDLARRRIALEGFLYH